MTNIVPLWLAPAAQTMLSERPEPVQPKSRRGSPAPKAGAERRSGKWMWGWRRRGRRSQGPNHGVSEWSLAILVDGAFRMPPVWKGDNMSSSFHQIKH